MIRRWSVQLELAPVVSAEGRVLVFLAQVAVPGRQHFDLRPHEAPQCLLRRAHDGLAADIEARVDEHWATRQLLEAGEQGVIARIRRFIKGLDASGVGYV